jgi:hypothetical protein
MISNPRAHFASNRRRTSTLVPGRSDDSSVEGTRSFALEREADTGISVIDTSISLTPSPLPDLIEPRQRGKSKLDGWSFDYLHAPFTGLAADSRVT